MYDTKKKRRSDIAPIAKASDRSSATFFNIQILRGIAASMVVLYHASEAWSMVAKDDYSRTWLGGSSGVDLFFVISGFVMAISSLGKGAGAGAAMAFFKRRVIRVMPLYWIVTSTLLLWFEVHFLRRGSALIHVSIRDAVLSFLLIPYNVDAAPLVGHAWTLSYEMFFYLCLALAIFTRKNAAYVLTLLLSLLVVLGFFRTDHWPVQTVLFSPWLLEFLAGLWLGIAAKKGLKLNTRISCSLGALALLLLWFGPSFRDHSQRFVWGLCAVCVVQAAVVLENKIGRRMPRWALLVGDASYSVYLVHPFLFGVLIALLSRLNIIRTGRLRFEDEAAMTLISLVCATAAGIILHKFVEYPISRLLTGKGRPVQVEASSHS